MGGRRARIDDVNSYAEARLNPTYKRFGTVLYVCLGSEAAAFMAQSVEQARNGEADGHDGTMLGDCLSQARDYCAGLLERGSDHEWECVCDVLRGCVVGMENIDASGTRTFVRRTIVPLLDRQMRKLAKYCAMAARGLDGR